MKKFALLFVVILFLTSCSIDDDGRELTYQYSEVISTDLPSSFEQGKTYTIDVTYLLPSACHTASGIEVKRGKITGDQRRDIYVVGISLYDAAQTECGEEDNEEDLEREAKFSIYIDEDETFTFYLWSGVNSNNENQYTVVEVPVN